MTASSKKTFYKKWHSRIGRAFVRVWTRHTIGGNIWRGFRSGWAAGYRAGAYDQRKKGLDHG